MNSTVTERVELKRDVQAVQIPSGREVTLHQGELVAITQSLGGVYTVHAPMKGGLYRISNKDADALGHTPAAPTATTSKETPEVTEEAVWNVLKTCYDPEIPVNIVDLGLIYSMELKPAETGDEKHIEIKMTLTAQGCGMGPVIAADARHRLLDLPGIASANVEIVWEPAWNPSMITPDGKTKLGIEG